MASLKIPRPRVPVEIPIHFSVIKTNETVLTCLGLLCFGLFRKEHAINFFNSRLFKHLCCFEVLTARVYLNLKLPRVNICPRTEWRLRYTVVQDSFLEPLVANRTVWRNVSSFQLTLTISCAISCCYEHNVELASSHIAPDKTCRCRGILH